MGINIVNNDERGNVVVKEPPASGHQLLDLACAIDKYHENGLFEWEGHHDYKI